MRSEDGLRHPGRLKHVPQPAGSYGGRAAVSRNHQGRGDAREPSALASIAFGSHRPRETKMQRRVREVPGFVGAASGLRRSLDVAVAEG